MRAILGVVSLLIVLAIVGVLATKQLKAVHGSVASAVPAATGASDAAANTPPANAGEQSQQLQQRVVNDVNKALAQGAQRNQDADK